MCLICRLSFVLKHAMKSNRSSALHGSMHESNRSTNHMVFSSLLLWSERSNKSTKGERGGISHSENIAKPCEMPLSLMTTIFRPTKKVSGVVDGERRANDGREHGKVLRHNAHKRKPEWVQKGIVRLQALVSSKSEDKVTLLRRASIQRTKTKRNRLRHNRIGCLLLFHAPSIDTIRSYCES